VPEKVVCSEKEALPPGDLDLEFWLSNIMYN
jgi:hypothetical protein